MAGLRPFRGLRYTQGAGSLGSLLSPPSVHTTPAEREGYAVRAAHSSVLVAQPEGHADDRSKFVRYARAAARVAEWRREGILSVEAAPSFYRLVQRFGNDPIVRTTLLAVADLDGLQAVEAADPKVKEDRLRLLEATRIDFEPAVAFYDDPSGQTLAAVRGVPASAEASGSLDGLDASLETIHDPQAVEAIARAFAGKTLLVADGAEALAAAREFKAGGLLVALASLDDASYARLAVHRVVRRLPGGRESVLARLATLFGIEEHHNRNLSLHLDRALDEGRVAFGMATEGGLGYLLTPRTPIVGPASSWLSQEVFGRLLGLTDNDPALTTTDPIQAVRTADEGAAAAFILPRPARSDILDAHRSGVLLPPRSVQTYPAIPTGLVFWSRGDDA